MPGLAVWCLPLWAHIANAGLPWPLHQGARFDGAQQLPAGALELSRQVGAGAAW